MGEEGEGGIERDWISSPSSRTVSLIGSSFSFPFFAALIGIQTGLESESNSQTRHFVIEGVASRIYDADR